MDINKIELYNYINQNKYHFLPAKGTKDEKLKKWLLKNNIHLPIENVTIKNVYDYLTNSKGKFCTCGKENIFKSFGTGYSKFCSIECLYLWRSNNMIGANNNAHKMSFETRKEMGRKNSVNLKKLISEGKFTPYVTNSWAKSRCIVIINRNNCDIEIKCRSSWDAYFQIKNPTCLYEKLRIPYEHNKNFFNYIVDFIDVDNKIIYEIKPSGMKETTINKIKFEYAKKWARENNYKFMIIGEEWFKQNYKESLLIGQPDEIKLKRLLNQFNI